MASPSAKAEEIFSTRLEFFSSSNLLGLCRPQTHVTTVSCRLSVLTKATPGRLKPRDRPFKAFASSLGLAGATSCHRCATQPTKRLDHQLQLQLRRPSCQLRLGGRVAGAAEGPELAGLAEDYGWGGG